MSDPIVEAGGHSGGLLRRKVFGKVPLIYVLGALVVILVVVAYKMKGSAAGAADTSGGDDADGTDDTSLTDGVDNTTDSGTQGAPALAGGQATGYGGFLANSNSGTGANPTDALAGNTPTAGVGNSTITDNDTWVRKGVEWEASQGASAGAAQNALQKYVNGEQLSYAEGSIRDAVIKQFGTPPETFTAGNTTAKPSTDIARKQGTPPCVHVVKGKSDNTFAALAGLYYQHPTGPNLIAAINHIRMANTDQLSRATYFDVGTKVNIPKPQNPRYYTSTAKTDTATEIGKANGRTANEIIRMNPTLHFPVKPGTRVQVT